MADRLANVLEKIIRSLGTQSTNLAPKYPNHDYSGPGVDHDLDVRYRQSGKLSQFIETKTFGEAYSYLKGIYDKLKPEESNWQIVNPNFPSESVEYWYMLKIYTRGVYNKLALVNLNKNQSKKAFEELEQLKITFENTDDKNEISLEIQVAAMKLLEKLVALKLVDGNDKMSDYIGELTIDETNYKNRRN